MNPKEAGERSQVAGEGVTLPGQTIGILGGGQLGRMMAMAARSMGYRTVVLDPAPNNPCAQVADQHILAAYTDVDAAKELARVSDVVTYEFENVDADVVRLLSEQVPVPQGETLLRTCQHRMYEKLALQDAGVPVAPFQGVRSLEDLHRAAEALSFPLVLKTTTGGYDGHGQWLIKSNAEIELLWASGPADVATQWRGQRMDGADAPLIAESFVSFSKEISVIVARNANGQTALFPVAENIHENHILHISIVPARIAEEMAKQAARLARQIAQSLNLIGVLAVEMFLLEDGQILVNELAPRPHNSGHYTLNGCIESQFEQHVRAICNLPLAEPTLHTPGVMVNILGQHVPRVFQTFASWPSYWKLHWYGKSGAKLNRKMGHVNILGSDVDAILHEVAQSGIW